MNRTYMGFTITNAEPVGARPNPLWAAVDQLEAGEWVDTGLVLPKSRGREYDTIRRHLTRLNKNRPTMRYTVRRDADGSVWVGRTA